MSKEQVIIGGELFEILFDEKRVDAAVRQTFDRLVSVVANEQKIGKEVVFLVLANGGNWFAHRLFSLFEEPLHVEYALLQSYENDVQSEMNVVTFPNGDCLRNKLVVVVDDILDSGKTMVWVTEHLKTLNVKNVFSVVLCRRCGNETPTLNEPLLIENNAWVVGCGMDSNHEGRNLEAIYRKGE